MGRTLLYTDTSIKGKNYTCPVCVCIYFNNSSARENHLWKKHPQLFHQFVCACYLNIFKGHEELAFYQMFCVIHGGNTRPVIFPENQRVVKWKEDDNFMKTMVHTHLVVADFECVLSKINMQKGDKTRLIHNHQPCAWVIVVQTIYGDAPFCGTHM